MSKGHKFKLYRAMDKRLPQRRDRAPRIGKREQRLRDNLLVAAKARLITAAEWCDKREPAWAAVEADLALQLIKCAKVVED